MPNERVDVQVRLTARDLKRVKALAASERVTVSEFVRRLIRTWLDADQQMSRERLDGQRGSTLAARR